jgi:hypothetical protein
MWRHAADDDGRLFGPVSSSLAAALAAGTRLLQLRHRMTCYIVYRTSLGPVVTHNSLGGPGDHVQAARFPDEPEALRFAHRVTGNAVRRIARERGSGFRAFILADGFAVIEHDMRRGVWTVVLGIGDPIVYSRTLPDDVADGWRFVEDVLTAAGWPQAADELDRYRDREAPVPAPAPELDPLAAEPELTGWRAWVWRLLQPRQD